MVLSSIKTMSFFRTVSYIFSAFIFLGSLKAEAISNNLQNQQNEELQDFSYQVELVMNIEQGVFGAIGDFITGSEIEEYIFSLRTFTEQNKKVSNIHVLLDRVKNDIAEIHKQAHMLGFYNAHIKHKVHFLKNNRVLLTLFVDFGKIFKLRSNITYLNQDENFHKRYIDELKTETNQLTSSIADIKQLITEAIHSLKKNGYYNPEVIEKRVWLNYAENEAVLNLTINPGEKVVFSTVTVESFPDIDTQFIKNRIIWEEGEIFDIDKIEQTSKALYATQIFSKVKVKPEEDKVADKKIPILISVKEDKKHTIDISLLYSGMRSMNFEKKSNANKSLKSIIGRISWMNCNAFGGGEKLRFIIEGTPIKLREHRTDYAFEISLVKPDIFIKNNLAEFIVSRRQELTNVFFKKNDKISAMFSYPLFFFSNVRVGGILENNYVDFCDDIFIKELSENKYYKSFTIPIEFLIDKTDDILNPTRGYKISGSYSYIKLRNALINTLGVGNLSFSYNISLDNKKKTVFAFCVVDRMIFGNNIDDIPLDKRIYAGGMNSVRGYGNQMATDAVIGNKTVMGGRSSIEFNTEIRRKVSKDFGLVLFFDGAKIFKNHSRYENMKIKKKRWFYSIGFGGRYFTSIGPIRADFAFPIKRRKGIDSKMQFILSLGQAF